MRILYLPYNVASMPAMTVNAMNKIEGVEAKYLVFQTHKYLLSYPEYEIRLSILFEEKKNYNYLFYSINILYKFFIFPFVYLFQLFKWVKWADIVHWTYTPVLPFGIDLLIPKLLNKKRFVEWVGSDIRNPEKLAKINKWYKIARESNYEYRYTTRDSTKNQHLFAKYGYVPILIPEMQYYLEYGLFQKIHPIQYRCFEVDKYKEVFLPKIQNDKIKILHTPSQLIAKGSNYIIPILNELKYNYPIDIIMLNNVSREIVIEEMKTCDIFIDQIVIGAYGGAAIEAMSFGKPCLAYILEEFFELGIPRECPIINANPDTLKERLIELIENPNLRKEKGIQSRQFVETYHDVNNLSHQLLEIYYKSYILTA